MRVLSKSRSDSDRAHKARETDHRELSALARHLGPLDPLLHECKGIVDTQKRTRSKQSHTVHRSTGCTTSTSRLLQLTFGADERAVVEGSVQPPFRGELRAHRPQPTSGWEELHRKHPTIHLLRRFLCLIHGKSTDPGNQRQRSSISGPKSD